MSVLSPQESSVLVYSPRHRAHVFYASSRDDAACEVGKALLADAGPAGIAVLSHANLNHRSDCWCASVRRVLHTFVSTRLAEITQRFVRHGGASRDSYRLTLPKGGRL